jgi:flagellin-like hook-associated protein FlgL
MSELKVMSLDPTKNSDDIANYDAEFTQLQAQLTNIKSESFNGIDLFNATGNLTVYTTEEGDAAGEPSVAATRTGLFQELGNVTYGGSDGGEAVSEYNNQADYAASDATTTTFVRSTDSNGNVRLGYVVTAIAGDGSSTFQDWVDNTNIVEITNVDSLYDYETGEARARVFHAGTSQHDGGDIVFDDDSNSFYITTGAAAELDYESSSTTAVAASITATAGSFEKLSKYSHVSDYNAFSTSEQYELGDIVSYNDKLYVANGSAANIINAGGAVPEGNGNFTELSSYAVTGADLLTTTNTLANYSVGDFTTFIQNAATARAQNGAEAARMNSALEMLKSNQGNIDAARSRLADVDVALESTNLAKQNILVQSAAAMLSQANASQNVALQLLS